MHEKETPLAALEQKALQVDVSEDQQVTITFGWEVPAAMGETDLVCPVPPADLKVTLDGQPLERRFAGGFREGSLIGSDSCDGYATWRTKAAPDPGNAPTDSMITISDGTTTLEARASQLVLNRKLELRSEPAQARPGAVIDVAILPKPAAALHVYWDQDRKKNDFVPTEDGAQISIPPTATPGTTLKLNAAEEAAGRPGVACVAGFSTCAIGTVAYRPLDVKVQ